MYYDRWPLRRRISGRHNPEIAADLFPQWSEDQRVCYYEGKEARFRQMASRSHSLFWTYSD